MAVSKKAGRIALRVYLVLLIVSVSLFATFKATQADQKIYAEAASPEILIQMDNSVVYSQVGPGQSGIANNSGQVTIRKWPYPGARVQTIMVNLEAVAEKEGWAVSVAPAIVTFTITDWTNPRPINGYCIAPRNAKFQDNNQIAIKGTWTAFPSSSTPLASGDALGDTYMVEVRQFYYTFLDSNNPFKTIWWEQTTSFELIVENQGNGNDSFLIEIQGLDALVKSGWVIQREKSSVTIGPYDKKTVKLFIYPPEKYAVFNNNVQEIMVKVTSKGSIEAGRTDMQQYSFFYHQFGPYLEPVPTVMIIVVVVALIWGYRKARDMGYF